MALAMVLLVFTVVSGGVFLVIRLVGTELRALNCWVDSGSFLGLARKRRLVRTVSAFGSVAAAVAAARRAARLALALKYFLTSASDLSRMLVAVDDENLMIFQACLRAEYRTKRCPCSEC